MSGTLTIDFTQPKTIKSSYNVKNKSSILIKTEGSDSFVLTEKDFLDSIKSVTASGNTLTLKIANKTIKFTDFTSDMIIEAYAVKSPDMHTYYSHSLTDFYNLFNKYKQWLSTPSSTSVTGSSFNETIDLSGEYTYVPTSGNQSKNIGVTINAAGGNDTITGTKYNDTITGGAGTNTVVVNSALYSDGKFGTDTIKLTNGEDLIVDLRAYYDNELTDEENIKNIKNKLSVVKNDLLLTLGEENIIKLASFGKSNVAGNSGKVRLWLGGTLNNADEVSVDLNNDKLFSYTNEDFIKKETKKGKTITKTATLTGNRFNKEVTITSDLELDDYTKTINMGNGKNTVNINGSGTNTVISGSDSDTINVYENTANTTIKAGKGVNTININSANFGEIVLTEEKVSATNIINFANDIIENCTFIKSDNDLVIANAVSKLTLKGYYIKSTTKNKYANIKFKINNADDYTDYETLFNLTGKPLTIGGKGPFNGTAGNDTFISSTSNDKFTGKTGENIIIFNGKFGKDTVNLTKDERLILDLTGYGDLSEDNIKYSFNKGNLVINVVDDNKKSYGTITIKNFGKSDVTGNAVNDGIQAGVFLRLYNSEIIDLRTKEYNINVTSNYTGGWQSDRIDAYTAKNAVTITGGKGDDALCSGGKKSTTFTFKEGDGEDKVFYTKSSDIIQIDSKNISYEKYNNNLIISYGDSDSVTIMNYFGSQTRVDKIKYKNSSGKYVTKSIQAVSGYQKELESHTIKNVRQSDGKVIIKETDNYDTINFVIHGSFSLDEGNGENGGEKGDLIITYDALNDDSNDKVIIKGYIDGRSKVKYMVTWNGQENITYPIPLHIGTPDNDDFGSNNLKDEYYFLYGGNDTITFEEDFGEYNYIYSEGAKSENTDTLYFKDLDYGNDDLVFERTYNGADDKLLIHYKDYSGTVEYNNYFSDNTPSVDIVDKDDTISLEKSEITENVDWSSDVKNHVHFVDFHDGQITKTINSNNKKNSINIVANNKDDDYNTKLVYTYNGGNDSVRTYDYYANDTYNVNSFTSASKLSVLDNGGIRDTLNITTDDEKDVYILFEVTKYTKEPTPNMHDTGFIHEDVMNVSTLRKFFEHEKYNDINSNISGVLKIAGAGFESDSGESEIWDNTYYGSTIENIKINNYEDGERVDIATWKTFIAKKVGDWMDKYSDELGECEKSILNIFQKISDGEIVMTGDMYDELLSCYKVKYSELPIDKFFEGTTENDDFVLGLANNTITINSAEIGQDTITSTINSRNTLYIDKIIFTEATEYSFADGSLGITVNDNDLIIGKSDDLNNSITYTDFITDENRNDLIIQDATGAKYSIHATSDGVYFYQNTNNIAFINVASSYPSINSSNGTNYIYSEGEYSDQSGKSGIYYTYDNGIDTVISDSDKASDTYFIRNFSESSKLNVIDRGGISDSILLCTQFYSSIHDSRLVFNVNSAGAVYNQFMFVHKNVLNGTTLNDTIQKDLVSGVLKFNMATTGNSFGVENIAYDYEWGEGGAEGNYLYANLDIWATKIILNVQNWLDGEHNVNNYTSAYEAFANYLNMEEADLDALIACYDVDYSKLNHSTVLEIDETTGKIEVPADEGYKTLNFSPAGAVEHKDLQYNIIGNDLVITYNDAEVTLTDYMKGKHSVKQVDVADGTIYEIPYHIGTSGDDTFTAQDIQDYFYLKGGNDTINFEGKDFTATNYIMSDGTSENTTTLVYDNYSLVNEQLDFQYNKYNNSLFVYANKVINDDKHSGTAEYENYFSDDRPTVIIQDAKGAEYTVDKNTTVVDADWTQEEDADKNHVSFLFAEGENKIISNNNTNYIYTETVGNELDYTYVGGQDKVNSDSFGDDTYNINSFGKKTRLVINDNGGNNSINFSDTDISDIRLVFDAGKKVPVFDIEKQEWTYTYTESHDYALIYSGQNGVFNSTTIKNFITSDTHSEWISGVAAVNMGDYVNEMNDVIYSQIETFTTKTGEIDFTAWKNQIVENIQGWLDSADNTRGYVNAREAFADAEHLSSEALSRLVQCYVDYDTALAQV